LKKNLFGNAIIAIASLLHVLAVWFTRKIVLLKIQILVADVDEIRIGQKIVMRKLTLEVILCKTETFRDSFFYEKEWILVNFVACTIIVRGHRLARVLWQRTLDLKRSE
jgi:hypothetical protein